MTPDEKLLASMLKLTTNEDEPLEYCLVCDKVFIQDSIADHMAQHTTTLSIRQQRADMAGLAASEQQEEQGRAGQE